MGGEEKEAKEDRSKRRAAPTGPRGRPNQGSTRTNSTAILMRRRRRRRIGGRRRREEEEEVVEDDDEDDDEEEEGGQRGRPNQGSTHRQSRLPS